MAELEQYLRSYMGVSDEEMEVLFPQGRACLRQAELFAGGVGPGVCLAWGQGGDAGLLPAVDVWRGKIFLSSETESGPVRYCAVEIPGVDDGDDPGVVEPDQKEKIKKNENRMCSNEAGKGRYRGEPGRSSAMGESGGGAWGGPAGVPGVVDHGL